MSKNFSWRMTIVFSASAVVIALADRTFAQQWGTNTSPCPSHCSPASPWWGYVQTHWTRWPGATYPDMLKAPGTSGEELPVPGVDLPTPSKESDIRSAPPSENKAPTAAPSQPEPQTDATSEPMPAKPAKPTDEPKQPELPSVKEAPGATPPSDEPFFSPPSTPSNTPPMPAEPPPATPSSNSSMMPRPKFHAAFSKPLHSVDDANDWNGQRDSHVDDTASAKPLRLRIDVDDFSRPMPSEQESAKASTIRAASQNGTNSNQRYAASENPLRIDYANPGVVAASATDNRSGSNYTSDAAQYSGTQAYQR